MKLQSLNDNLWEQIDTHEICAETSARGEVRRQESSRHYGKERSGEGPLLWTGFSLLKRRQQQENVFGLLVCFEYSSFLKIQLGQTLLFR